MLSTKTKNEMKIFLIIISVLLSVICVLLALLQHYYLITKLYKRPSIRYDVPVFEDLISPYKDRLYTPNALQTFKECNDDDVLNDLNSVLESQTDDIFKSSYILKNDKVTGTDSEVYHTLQAAIAFKLSGKKHKAMKLFEHAAAIAPENADVLNSYGEFLEQHQDDILSADELYFKALTYEPNHEAALVNRKRTAPVVDGLDYLLFKHIDERNDFLKTKMKKDEFGNVKKQAYYLHIYHTVGIEGNTMTVQQLRYLLETGQVVSGKSLVEHNEVLGLEKAMQYIKLLVSTQNRQHLQ